jgi:hypothetical protein
MKDTSDAQSKYQFVARTEVVKNDRSPNFQTPLHIRTPANSSWFNVGVQLTLEDVETANRIVVGVLELPMADLVGSDGQDLVVVPLSHPTDEKMRTRMLKGKTQLTLGCSVTDLLS